MEQHEPSGTDAPWVTQWVTQRMGAAGTRASDSVRLAVCQLLVWSCVCAVLLLDAAHGFAFGRWRKLSRVGCRGLELNSFSLCPSPSSASSHVSAVNCEAKQNKPPASPLFFFFFFTMISFPALPRELLCGEELRVCWPVLQACVRKRERDGTLGESQVHSF